MPTNKAKYSVQGLPYESAVDVDALSMRARAIIVSQRLTISTAAGQHVTAVFAQNTTRKHPVLNAPCPMLLLGAVISAQTAPAGGTLTWNLVKFNGSTETALTDTSTNPESVTSRMGQVQVLAATNAALATGDMVELHCIADNNAVTQDAVTVQVTTYWQAVEASPPTR
jgi:hypothetical protein